MQEFDVVIIGVVPLGLLADWKQKNKAFPISS